MRVVVKSIYYCASVSEQAFKELSAEDAEPFICFCCFKTKKEKQIDTLQTTVESLKADIESLKAASRSTVTSTVSYSDAVSADRLLPTLSSMNADPRQVAGEKSLSSVLPSSDKKFNVVLYGVGECPSGLSKSARFELDLSNAAKVLSSINNSIGPNSVKDCFRLGKYSPGSSRPRPILVKFIRISDVTNTLSKSNLSHPYTIKPDMSREQRVSTLEREMAPDSIRCAPQ